MMTTLISETMERPRRSPRQSLEDSTEPEDTCRQETARRHRAKRSPNQQSLEDSREPEDNCRQEPARRHRSRRSPSQQSLEDSNEPEDNCRQETARREDARASGKPPEEDARRRQREPSPSEADDARGATEGKENAWVPMWKRKGIADPMANYGKRIFDKYYSQRQRPEADARGNRQKLTTPRGTARGKPPEADARERSRSRRDTSTSPVIVYSPFELPPLSHDPTTTSEVETPSNYPTTPCPGPQHPLQRPR